MPDQSKLSVDNASHHRITLGAHSDWATANMNLSHPRRVSNSRAHVGRGGVANVFQPSQDEVAAASRDNEVWESAVGDEPKVLRDKGLAEKGKEWLFGSKGRNT
jgi:hypothetical protein